MTFHKFLLPLVLIATLLLTIGAYYLGYLRGQTLGNSNSIVPTPTPDQKQVDRQPMRPINDGGVACTMDAKICPDGSAVGRVPPSCEFAPCPSGGDK
jgi:energy-converting hydrogenase Eha subunit F